MLRMRRDMGINMTAGDAEASRYHHRHHHHRHNHSHAWPAYDYWQGQLTGFEMQEMRGHGYHHDCY